MTKQTADKQNYNLDEKKQREGGKENEMNAKWETRKEKQKQRQKVSLSHWLWDRPWNWQNRHGRDSSRRHHGRAGSGKGSEEGSRGVRQMTFAFNHKFAGRAFGNPSPAQLSPRHNLMAINNFSTAKTNTNLHFRNTKSALNCKSRPPRDPSLSELPPSVPLQPTETNYHGTACRRRHLSVASLSSISDLSLHIFTHVYFVGIYPISVSWGHFGWPGSGVCVSGSSTYKYVVWGTWYWRCLRWLSLKLFNFRDLF